MVVDERRAMGEPQDAGDVVAVLLAALRTAAGEIASPVDGYANHDALAQVNDAIDFAERGGWG